MYLLRFLLFFLEDCRLVVGHVLDEHVSVVVHNWALYWAETTFD